jgi:hypothetical protein
MGLVWREVRILAQRSTTSSKGFLSIITTHVMHCIYCKYAILRCSYFCPLQVKNKPHDGDAKHAFIIGPVSLVANSFYQKNVFLKAFFQTKIKSF